MGNDDLEELRQLKFMPSRIPALDALEVFVPSGAERDPELEEIRSRTGQSRWYPMEGGHRVRVLYEGGQFNAARFTLVRGGWDHEHSSRCHGTIEPMTLCWVTESDPYVLLDEKCYRQVAGPEPAA